MRWEQLRGFDPSGALLLPGWAVVALLAVVLIGALVIARGNAGRAALVFIFAATMAWALAWLDARDFAAERGALEARAFELRMHALGAGPPLACLDAGMAKTVRDACEKSVFATAESTAAAISYVAAQLSLLSASGRHSRERGVTPSQELASLRRAIEADPFGIVAHVLTKDSGCRPEACELFPLLQDRSRISANLRDRPFDALLSTHAAQWSTAGQQQVVSSAPAASVRPSSKLFFPSASSIPPVNIMAAEPTQPSETTASADPGAASKARRAGQGTPPASQAPAVDSARPRSGPLQIAPSVQ
jgi:hypothetical protein